MIYTEEQDRHSHMPDNAPNAPEDRPPTLQDLTTALAAVELRITAAIEASGKQTAEAIATSEARAAEHARDLQTEILRALESFARGNFARFHTVDARAHHRHMVALQRAKVSCRRTDLEDLGLV